MAVSVPAPRIGKFAPGSKKPMTKKRAPAKRVAVVKMAKPGLINQ